MLISLKEAEVACSTSVKCTNPVPGISQMLSGVDITQLDLMPTDGSGFPGGFRNPVLDVSCDQGATRVLDEIEYDVPDQVSGERYAIISSHQSQ